MINISQFYQGSTTTSTNFTTLTLSQVFFKQFCSIFLLALLENVRIIHCKTLCTNSNIPKQTDGKFWGALETTTRHKERKWPMWAKTILQNSMKCTCKIKRVLKNSSAYLFINFFWGKQGGPLCPSALASWLPSSAAREQGTRFSAHRKWPQARTYLFQTKPYDLFLFLPLNNFFLFVCFFICKI